MPINPQPFEIISSSIPSSDFYNYFIPSLNSYFPWREKSSYFGLPSKFINCLAFLSGVFFLIKSTSILLAISLAISFFYLIFAYFGTSSVIINSIAWLPWLIYALRVGSKVKLILFSVLLAINAYQLAPLIALSALLYTISDSKIEDRKNLSPATLLSLFLPALLILVIIPQPTYPNYSGYDVRLTLDDEIWSYTKPFWGNFSGYYWISRAQLITFLTPLIVTGLLLALILSLLVSTKNRYFSLTIFLLLSAELYLPANIAAISPLVTLARIIPDLIYIPYQIVLGVLGFFFLVIDTSSTVTSHTKANTTLPELIIIFVLLSLSQLAPSRANNRLLPGESATPSLLVERYFPKEILSQARHEYKLLNPRKFITCRASHNQDLVKKLFDNKKDTRWFAHRGQQKGDEWLKCQLDKKNGEQLSVSGIYLDLGHYVADYPRGIKLKYASSCQELDQPGRYQELAYANWFGAPAFTKDRAPYIAAKNLVKLHFKNDLPLGCFAFYQTNLSNRYDLSLTAIKLMVK
jgi:hypothetical protein